MKYHQYILNQMRFLNKRIFNRVTLKFAGSAYSPISIIRHVGRRSGTPYGTPVIVLGPFLDQFVFALPYGHEVDWYRNILATGRGTVVCRGKEYPLENPKTLVAGADHHSFPLALRLIVRIVGAQHFIQMRSS